MFNWASFFIGLINQSNNGYGTQLNFGLSATKIVFCDYWVTSAKLRPLACEVRLSLGFPTEQVYHADNGYSIKKEVPPILGAVNEGRYRLRNPPMLKVRPVGLPNFGEC